MAASLVLSRSSTASAVSARPVSGGNDDKAVTAAGASSLTIPSGKVVTGRSSLAASGTATLDLNALVQADSAGDTVETVNFATVYHIAFRNASANSAAVAVVGAAASTGFFNTSGGTGAAAHTVSLPADSVWRDFFFLRTGGTTSSRNNILITAGSGGALVLDWVVVGTT